MANGKDQETVKWVKKNYQGSKSKLVRRSADEINEVDNYEL